jgi:hypothetical protein
MITATDSRRESGVAGDLATVPEPAPTPQLLLKNHPTQGPYSHREHNIDLSGRPDFRAQMRDRPLAIDCQPRLRTLWRAADKQLRGKLGTVIDQIEQGHHVFRAYWKNAFLKQYEKFCTFLRNELCSNNLCDLRKNS